MKYNFYRLVFLFLLTSLFGFLIETIGGLIRFHTIEDRGFLGLPLLPIYGFGSVLIVLALNHNHFTSLQVFLISIILTTTLEYFTGLFFRQFSSHPYWDYSSYPINIGGIISLWSSVGFGIGGMTVNNYIYPSIHKKMEGKDIYLLRIYLLPPFIIVMTILVFKTILLVV